MKITLILVPLLLTVSTAALAGFGSSIGIGYLAKVDGVKVYSHSTNDDVDDTVKKGFPFIAFESSSVLGGIMAAESISGGRLHVRYYRNGKDRADGENTAWLDPKDVLKFPFDCCGDAKCSGIKAVIFKTATFSDCFNLAMSEATAKIEVLPTPATDTNAEIEKLKLQLEIEKLKLERAKLRQGEP